MRERIQLSGSVLKWFAMITMLIDHTGAVVIAKGLYGSFGGVVPITLLERDVQTFIYDLYHVMRGIGRLAFPIFCFFLVEGFLKTHNVKKYAFRLFLFGLLSEIPFDFALFGKIWDPGYQNVMFTLLIGLGVLFVISALWNGEPENLRMSSFLGILAAVAAGCGAAWALKTDYSWKGVLLIAAIYLFRYRRDAQCLVGAAAIAWENWAPLSFGLLYFYNGKRGRQSKYGAYLFYPVHLLMLAGIAQIVVPWYFNLR